MFPIGSRRSDHYVDSPQGKKHDADMTRLESGHKANLDLGHTTQPDQDSHDPHQPNFEHAENNRRTGSNSPGEESTPVHEL